MNSNSDAGVSEGTRSADTYKNVSAERVPIVTSVF